jgi:predicted ester cyclase
MEGIFMKRLRPALRLMLPVALLLGSTATVSGAIAPQAKASKPVKAAVSSKTHLAEINRLKKQLLDLAAADASVQANLKNFDTLDFDVYSNQQWDRLKESHAANIKVFWPDGRVTEGIDAHIADLKQTFYFAPDTRIKEHPIKFGSGNMTAVTGVFEGTFTKPLPDGKGGVIPPTGKAFKISMATISIWKDGLIVEEHLFLDNATFFKQIGLG